LLNKKKNRTDPVKTAVQLFTFGDFLTLEAERPQTWQQNQARGVVEKLGEDTPVSLVGFLIDLHPGLPETCNCKLPGEDNNDFHLNIVARVGDGLRDSVVLEMTPKVRKNVAEWTRANLLTRLNPNPNQPPMVRISGYLLFDSEHVSRSGGARATIWEIHPVTKLEFCQSGSCASSSTAGWQTMGELQ